MSDSRNFRIPDEEYHPAQIVAARNGESVTDVVRHAIREEVAVEERKASGRTLTPEPPNGRMWYRYRHGKIIEAGLIMSDEKAFERRLLGQDLWPMEWGMR